jgi:general secretion pathway protein F
MQFRARAFDADSGTVIERLVEGDSAEMVAQSLAGEGLAVLSVSAVRANLLGVRRPGFDVMLFCEELRTLLSSGMSLIEAVDTLCSKHERDASLQVLRELRQRLLEGKPLSAALETNAHPFPPLLVASIRASERSSRISNALDEYTAYERIGRDLTRKVVSAAIYPSLVIGFGGLVSLFMIAYVVPRFAQVYEDFSSSLSWPTMVLIRVGQFAGEHLLVLVAGLVAAGGWGVAGYRSGGLIRFALRVLRRLAFVQRQLRTYQLARIYQTTAMLLRGGYPLSDALPLAQQLAFEPRLRDQLSAARVHIMEGRRLSVAFEKEGLTDQVTLRLLQVGERSGDLAQVMDVISQGQRQDFTLFVERTTRMAEPILLMTVGLLIGAIIVLMYMPVFDLAGGVGG